jgi:hypothetical protein
MPLMGNDKHFRKRLGKRGIAFSWASSVLAQQNGKGMGMAAPERVRLLATARKQARDMLLHSHARIKPSPLSVVLLSPPRASRHHTVDCFEV